MCFQSICEYKCSTSMPLIAGVSLSMYEYDFASEWSWTTSLLYATYRVFYGIKKNILGFYKIYLLTCALICTVSCRATEGWQEVFGIFLEELASLLDLSMSLPIFLLPLPPWWGSLCLWLKPLRSPSGWCLRLLITVMGRWVVPTDDINTYNLVCLEILPYHNNTVGIRVWYLHFHSGCVAELGAGSWVFLFPVPLSFSGHWTYGALSFPPQLESGNSAPCEDRREAWAELTNKERMRRFKRSFRTKLYRTDPNIVIQCIVFLGYVQLIVIGGTIRTGSFQRVINPTNNTGQQAKIAYLFQVPQIPTEYSGSFFFSHQVRRQTS